LSWLPFVDIVLPLERRLRNICATIASATGAPDSAPSGWERIDSKPPSQWLHNLVKWHDDPLQVGVVRSMNEVTNILSAIEAGDPHAAADLLPLVYEELRQLAAV